MVDRYNAGAYVKLAKLWKKRETEAIGFHNRYYEQLFGQENNVNLVRVYIDITGKKETYNRENLMRLLRDCRDGRVNLIVSRTRGYLAANSKELCYLLKYIFTLDHKVEIITEDGIDTIRNYDSQVEQLNRMANEYVEVDKEAYAKWLNALHEGIEKLEMVGD